MISPRGFCEKNASNPADESCTLLPLNGNSSSIELDMNVAIEMFSIAEAHSARFCMPRARSLLINLCEPSLIYIVTSV